MSTVWWSRSRRKLCPRKVRWSEQTAHRSTDLCAPYILPRLQPTPFALRCSNKPVSCFDRPSRARRSPQRLGECRLHKPGPASGKDAPNRPGRPNAETVGVGYRYISERISLSVPGLPTEKVPAILSPL